MSYGFLDMNSKPNNVFSIRMLLPNSSAVSSAVAFASHEKVSLNVPKKVRSGTKVIVSGTVIVSAPTPIKAQIVSVQKRDSGRWYPLVHAVIRTRLSKGHFRATIALSRPGNAVLRATVVNHVKPRGLGDSVVPIASVSPIKVSHVTVPPLYASQASFYTDYGLPLACGGTMGSNQLGVANKTLPCGTPVFISYHGHTLTVPVIDRGPYIAGRSFDLSGATAARIHFNIGKGVDTIYTNPQG
jgi:hypothetical protein